MYIKHIVEGLLSIKSSEYDFLVCTLYYLDSYQVEYIEIDKYKLEYKEMI